MSTTMYFLDTSDESWTLKIDGVEERIENIWVYKCPLSMMQLTMALFNHQFVVLETNTLWWSIEKNPEGIAIQMGNNLWSVKDRYGGKPRKTSLGCDVEEMSSDSGRGSIKDLVDWLYRNGEVKKPHNDLFDNSKDFAKRVFDEFSATKHHSTL